LIALEKEDHYDLQIGPPPEFIEPVGFKNLEMLQHKILYDHMLWQIDNHPFDLVSDDLFWVIQLPNQSIHKAFQIDSGFDELLWEIISLVLQIYDQLDAFYSCEQNFDVLMLILEEEFLNELNEAGSVVAELV
jgi:hypothetical protein